MAITITKADTDGSARETGPFMHRMVDLYCHDMLPYVHLSLPEVFDLVKSIPYNADPVNEETLQRPYYTMNQLSYGGDCDDKCIALASWARLNSLPYRFIAVRKNGYPCLHHVLCEIYLDNNGGWTTADPTYKFNVLGRECDTYVERVII
jgi:transglutaminase-like putative cysteine protease